MATVVQAMRRTRRLRRLGELEWFDVAYRVYLFALGGGIVVLWLSGLVTDEPATPAELADVTAHGPAVIGVALAVAVALGLRSGSDGGPISVEAPDVRHLLLAPVSRRSVLVQPTVQRLRSVTFGGALGGLVAGQLAARRLPGSGVAWAASGALAGAAVGAAFVAVAVIAHTLTPPRWVASGLGLAVLVAQAGSVAGWWPGPGDGIGSLAMWGMRQRPVDLVSLAVVGLLAAIAVASAGRLRLEPLVHRADLVSQLRFAVTMQDLRTVVLIRRQLRGERPRRHPWVRPSTRRSTPQGATGAIWRRSWHGLLRYPLARLGRMAVLAAGGGLAAAAVLRGTTPALVAVGLALYLLGLDAMEPLSQEVDHPDLTDAMPHERGWLLVRLLAAPALALIPLALLGAAVVIVDRPDAWVGALVLAVPITLGGASGAVLSVIRDAPDPLSPPLASSAAVPPEFAGFTSTVRLLWPIVVSSAAAVPVLAARELPTAGSVVRSVAALALLLGAVVWWVRRRDELRQRWRRFLDAGRRAAGSGA